MNTPQHHRLFTRSADRMDVFRGDPPATKLWALCILEICDTVRSAFGLLRVPVSIAMLIYLLRLVALLKVSGYAPAFL